MFIQSRFSSQCRKISWVASISICISGCSANYNSIYRGKAVPDKGGFVTLVDAKQRAIISSTIGTDKQLVMCAEASPDVFSVYASALAAGAKLEKSADPSSLGLAGNLSYSSAETGSTIPRTATVTMLREMMYRTCERYLDGAISKLELPIQAARDQRVMIAALAIEGLTGAIRPPTTIIRADGTASSGASSSVAAEQLTAARQDVLKAEADEIKKQKTLDDLNAADPKCTAKEIDDAANATKKKSCANATVDLATAKKTASSSRDHYDNINNAVMSGSIPTAASTKTDGQIDDGADGRDAASISAVADTVERIVIKNFEEPEFLYFCLKLFSGELSKNDTKAQMENPADALRDTCVAYASAGLKAEAARYSDIAGDLNAINVQKQTDFDIFWSKILDSANPNRADPAKLASAVASAISMTGNANTQSKLNALAKDNNKSAIRIHFMDLPDRARFMLQSFIG